MADEKPVNEYVQKIRNVEPYKMIAVPLGFLKPVDYNPRDITEDGMLALMNSMEEDPDFIRVRPLIVNKHQGREGFIIAGDKRYIAASRLAWDKIPCIFVDAPKDQEKAWNIKDNLHQGAWNPTKRRDVLVELRDSKYNMETLGYTPEQLVTDMNFEVNPNTDAPNPGTTPKKEVQCPECGAIFKPEKKEK